MRSTLLACPCCADQRLYPETPERWSLAGRRCLALCLPCGGRCTGRYRAGHPAPILQMLATK